MRTRLFSWFTCLSALVACGDAKPAAISGEGTGAGLALEAGEAPSGLAVQYTEYLGQLTGRKPNPYSDELGMAGTDLGISFQRDDTLYFLFGDTWTRTWNDQTMLQDPIAKTSAARPANGVPELQWFTDPMKHWQPLLPGTENMGEYNLPVEGIPVQGGTYLFFHAAFDREAWIAKHSVLAFAPRTTDGVDHFDQLEVKHTETTSTKFLSVSAFVENATVYIFGAGKYRQSPVHVARVALDKLEDRSSWEYWAAEAGWQTGEGNAKPIMNTPCVGELSVRQHAQLGYLMTYNCMPYEDASNSEAASYPGSIMLRVASRPEGPWSAELPIFTRPEAERRFMHAIETTPEGVVIDDGFGIAQEHGMPGGLYGPYLVPAWFDEPGPGLHGIVYTLSTWRPYEVHLLRTVLAEPGYHAEPPASPRGQGLPRAELQNPRFETGTTEGWTATGLPFRVFQDPSNEGKWTVESARGDVPVDGPAQVGSLAQTFTIDAATSTLSFRIYGSRTSVVLLDADDAELPDEKRDVLRWTEPNDGVDGVPVPILVRWNLELLRGRSVKLVIKDDQPSPSDFIAASDFRLE